MRFINAVMFVAAMVMGLGRVGAWGALEPNEIALVVNGAMDESREVAEYYCLRRGVPREHIIAVTLPTVEDITYREYHETVVPAVREGLAALGGDGKIRCLVSCYGVPIRIGRRYLTAVEQERMNRVEFLFSRYMTQAAQLTVDYRRMAGMGGAEPMVTPAVKRNERIGQVTQLLGQLEQAARAGQEQIAGVDYERRDSLNARFWGLQGQRKAYLERLGVEGISESMAELLKGKVHRLEERMVALKGEYDELTAREAEDAEAGDDGVVDWKAWERRYAIVAESAGVGPVVQMLLEEWLKLTTDETTAAFDSELSLLWWGDYATSGWVANALAKDIPGALRADERFAAPGATLMVSRLDGPSVGLAKRLIDDAVEAEKTVLQGEACFDGRGKAEDAKVGSFGYYDASLRAAAKWVDEETGLTVIRDDEEALLPAGSAEDAVLYCGWYSLRRYVGTCRFVRGAVGYHIASFEGETVGRDHPESEVWCKRMIEEGIAGTLGAVAEPYLHSFPMPDKFFRLWVEGDVCLVECYYQTKPFNSWMMMLIGDPLYRPTYAKGRGFRPAGY